MKKNETAGIDAEYKWIRDRYPGSRNLQQVLQMVNGKHYDALTIETADGETKTVYFDITHFYGKRGIFRTYRTFTSTPSSQCLYSGV